jgi:hypothetical protein
MNLAFHSSLNPGDIHNWSGTLYFMYQTLCDNFCVTWICGNIFHETMLFHKKMKVRKSRFSQKFIPFFLYIIIHKDQR